MPALGAAALILALDRGRPAWLFRVFGARPLAWLGRISYGLYLWYFPVTGLAGDSRTSPRGRGRPPRGRVAPAGSRGTGLTTAW
ncbi:hypothetical protein I6A84_28720 [Frankia sp. CNm7]|uniref:Acyltransferase 3 domain-containing protein n=1 Tax=Frankia nepalensis TaxID=1836974 RepID=A0A937UU85_9ACTN|nr:hypothetical protein [Frankia nepalensis]MBL7494995.1 hypothetical protein [Frankia nepalensis]MBL7514694.1 hypothetical protein [Frankia nepalensis]MBL7521957.1 hypothetical protein [Frankia nepalensis]MBL7631995.1 hypothetical protein [Frankia nepalensis]